jgi:hypothetical protein
VQFDSHPEASLLCAVKDLGEPREASRSLRGNKLRVGSLLAKLHHYLKMLG